MSTEPEQVGPIKGPKPRRAVYLCGGINGLSDADATDWREQAKQWLSGIEILDPMRRDYRGVEDSHVDEIVKGDIKDIAESRYVLAMCTRPSWGTAMEIFLAYNAGRSVFIIIPSGPISPWLKYHSSARFTSLRQGCDAILQSERWLQAEGARP
jgi:hypothetical protein